MNRLIFTLQIFIFVFMVHALEAFTLIPKSSTTIPKTLSKSKLLHWRTSSSTSISSSIPTSLFQDSLSTTTTSSLIVSASTLSLSDPNVVQGIIIALSGLVAGIVLVAFTEERGKRSNLSESMATRIAGSLMEDVEVSSVSDLGGLTSQLEKALRESGNIENQDDFTKVLTISEDEKKKKALDADDGW